MGVLSYDRLTSLRVIWSRVKNAKLCEYILNRQDLETPMPKLLARLQKIMTVHFPYDAILDDESAESPVLLEHHTGPEPPVAQSGLNSRKMSRFDVLKSSMLGMTPQINSREGSALLIRDSSRTSASCMATDMESMRAIYSKSTFDDQSSVLSYLPNPYLQGIEIGLERSHRREPKSHLVVFVHGLLGSSFDFRQYRNRLSKQHLHMGIDRSDHMYLISRSNEDDTLIDMTKQGNNLGKEISAFIQEQGLIIDKISFVCHSMGGIIARVAITTKYLEVYKDHFYEFVTYGTPHVSLIYHTHTLINSCTYSTLIHNLHTYDGSKSSAFIKQFKSPSALISCIYETPRTPEKPFFSGFLKIKRSPPSSISDSLALSRTGMSPSHLH